MTHDFTFSLPSAWTLPAGTFQSSKKFGQGAWLMWLKNVQYCVKTDIIPFGLFPLESNTKKWDF